MSANLTLPNAYYSVYCNELFERQTALCIMGNNVNSQTVVPGTNQLVVWSDPASSIFEGVVLNPNTVFTLSSRGVYLIDFSITVDAPAATGAQGQVTLLVNGTGSGTDIAFSVPSGELAQGNIKLTIKGFVEQINDTPSTVSFNLSSTVASFVFRYANLSITKVGTI